MQTVYQSFSDPGHGWLKVRKSELVRLGINGQITSCSYQNGDFAYLEEDCDLSTFMRAKEARGEKVEMRHSSSNSSSRIRNYPHFTA